MTALIVAATAMLAVPAKRGVKKIVTLSDGSVVELALKGDEHFSYYVDEKGQPCQVQDGELITMAADEVSKTWKAQKQMRLAVTAENGTVRRASRRAGTPSQATTGTHRGLVILMQFKDKKFVTKSPQAVFNDFFNKEGYNDGGMSGSVRDYFKAQSYGNLNINFDVVGPYTTANNMAYYGKHQGKSNDANAAVMAGEAVDKAAADVNFADYDWDGDGEVDQVFIIYAGYSEAQGADENTIWPHEWYISQQSSSRRYNGKKIDKYGCASELMGKSGSTLDGIGTACHEFSHCLGLPDMYDTDTSKEEGNFGMSYWDVMDQGSYNNNSLTPAGYSSYERWFAGWLTPIEINSKRAITGMKPLATTGEAYVLYNEATKSKGIEGEFYLLENRQPVDFDAALPGHGMLILHVDYDATTWWNNSVNVDADHQRMTIIPADNDFINLAGDPWPGTKGKTTLGNLTTPVATLYRNNTNGKKLMNKPISNITEDVTAKTVSFMACYQEVEPVKAADIEAEAKSNDSFTITWPAVNGAVGYEIELTTKGPSTPAKSLFYENNMEKCYSTKVGTKDISEKDAQGRSKYMSSYGLQGWQGEYLYTSPDYLLIGSSSWSGNALTKAFEPCSSGDVTAVIGAKAKSGSVECTVYCLYAYANDNYYSVGEHRVLSVSADAKQVVSFTDVPGDYFAVYIVPDAQMYLNYFALYDGEWTAEQLGVGNASLVARRAAVTTSYTSTTNSYTFTGLDDERRYLYRVRAINNENVCSEWSEKKDFDFNSYTGIMPISVKTAADDGTVRYFDLQGREVPADTKGLLIRKQGSEVKKIIVK